MSETYPPEGEGHIGEPVPPAAPPQPPYGVPPAPQPPVGAPPAPPAPQPPYGAPAQEPPYGVPPSPQPPFGTPVNERRYIEHPAPAKPALDKGFAAMGCVTPIVVGALIGFLGQALSDVSYDAANVLSVLTGGLQLGFLVAAVACWLIGRQNGNNRLRSFGIGALMYYVGGMLLFLLLFGACAVLMSGV